MLSLYANSRKFSKDKKVLMPLVTEQIHIDMNDGVLADFNKFGQTIEEVINLNDPKKKKAVKEFDWVDSVEIR